MEGWINPSTIADARPIFEWSDGSSYGVHCWLSVAAPSGGGVGCLFANLADQTGQFHVLTTGPGLIQSGHFQHIALSYNGSVAALYINGTKVAFQTLGSFVPRTSADLYLGFRPVSIGGGAFAGVLDEFTLYKRALSDSEIATIVGASSGGKCPPSTPPPTIFLQPSSVSVFPGGSVTFTVGASGTGPLSYQWFNNNSLIVGATGSTLALTVPNSQPPTVGGSYTVVVSNAGGSVISQPAVLTVVIPANTAPFFTSPLADQTIDEDKSITINLPIADLDSPVSDLIVAVASSNTSLLPLGNIVVLTGPSRAVSLTPGANLSGSVQVTVTVTDPQGLKASSTFTLTVNQ